MSLFPSPQARFPQAIRQRLRQIKLLLVDVDGVLTNSHIVWDEAGVETKHFNVKDGQGLRRMRKLAGIKTGIVTARQSELVARRAKELDFDFVFQAVSDKLSVVKALCEQEGFTPEQVAYVGDDWPDLPVQHWVGLPCCPADAIRQVKQACLVISQQRGGEGAVREITDLLSACKESST